MHHSHPQFSGNTSYTSPCITCWQENNGRRWVLNSNQFESRFTVLKNQDLTAFLMHMKPHTGTLGLQASIRIYPGKRGHTITQGIPYFSTDLSSCSQ